MKPTELAAASIVLFSGLLFPLKAVSQASGVQSLDQATKQSWSQKKLLYKDGSLDIAFPSFVSLLGRAKSAFFMDDFWIHAVKQVRYSVDMKK